MDGHDLEDLLRPPGNSHEHWMRYALREAEAALEAGDVPVGAVIVKDGRIIGRGHNQRELLKDPTAHAEMIAITQAAAELENWRLSGATLYVTLEPCPMCAGALVNARLKRLVYGAGDPRAGACGSVMNVAQDEHLNHHVEIVLGVLAEESSAMLADFFRRRRGR
ncbi:MAG: tRNA adenosine(34) deaminase TadA [Planctomycetes bacterium]|nr:tRNA adenosine(34) deaminase TadA [Planctomycetota bacterium]